MQANSKRPGVGRRRALRQSGFFLIVATSNDLRAGACAASPLTVIAMRTAAYTRISSSSKQDDLAPDAVQALTKRIGHVAADSVLDTGPSPRSNQWSEAGTCGDTVI